ncbi:MAG: gliding motility lipoprotein GldH [Crocinitomicaceae bacterium]|nr:gliding motility lipoprotein GldH [Crocinitomicaceae bacterium]
MQIRNSILLVLLSVVLFSCGEQSFYEKVVAFDDREWKLDVKPEYTFEVKDVSKEYDFTLSLRTSTDYQYSNLWIFMKTITPDGTIAREPFEIVITNDDGSWVGEKSGSVVTTPLYFRSRKLPKAGKYSFIIEQGITQSKVDEVLDLSFMVEESKPENQ